MWSWQQVVLGSQSMAAGLRDRSLQKIPSKGWRGVSVRALHETQNRQRCPCNSPGMESDSARIIEIPSVPG